MTVSTLNSSTSSSANGVQRTFYFDFGIVEVDHILVYTIDTASSGTQELQSAYAVDEGWGGTGGSVTFQVDEQPADGLTVLIKRNVPVTQETDYIPGDPFPAETHEDALDKLTMIVQDSEYVIQQAITVPDGDTATNLVLDFASARANEYLYFDADGNVTTVEQATGTYDVSEWAKTLLDDEDAEEARTTMEMYSSTGRYTKSQTGTTVALTPGASTAWDCDTAQIASITLTANRGMANPTNMYTGGTYVLTVIQDGTGSRSLSWGSAYKFEDATDPTLSSGAGEKTIIFFWSDGTYLYGGTFWKEVS